MGNARIFWMGKLLRTHKFVRKGELAFIFYTAQKDREARRINHCTTNEF